MRWIYIKNGDVVSQLRQLRDSQDTQAGPNAFLADLLRGINDDQALMMSWCSDNRQIESGNIKAFSYQVNGSRFGKIGNLQLRFLSTLKAMLKVIRFQPQRIICGRIGPMLWMTTVVSMLLSIPYIHSRHNSLYEDQAKWYQKLLAKLDVFCIRHANAVICHGPFLCAQMEEIGVSRDRVIEFDVAFSDFNAGSSSEQLQVSETRDILFIGRVARNKGVFDLLSAAEKLIRSYPDIQLKYIGDGPDLNSLQETIMAEGLAEQVSCLGKIDHSDLPAYINASYVVVTPTRREFPEGRCLAAMEALACKIPLIAPSSGPFPYLVEHDVNGMLYEPDDVKSLAQALTRIATDAEYYNQLKKGAIVTADKLRVPIRTFYQAVEIAFND